VRYVLIDRLVDFRKGERARARKSVTRGEGVLDEGGRYPAPLVLEALLQTGGTLARLSLGPERRTVLGKVTKADFPAFARAGDVIDLDVALVPSRPDGTMCAGTASVGDTVVGRAEFMIVILPPELSPPPSPEIDAWRRNLARALGIPLTGGNE